MPRFPLIAMQRFDFKYSIIAIKMFRFFYDFKSVFNLKRSQRKTRC